MSIQFGLSWIYEEFHAVRMSHSKCVKEWRSPTPVTNLHEFSQALNAACKELDMRRGGEVAIAYESDEHSHIFLDIPPMSVRDMEKYLNRRVEQEKNFDETPAWGYRSNSNTGNGKGVLLHVMPANIRNAIMRICEENYVIPRRLLPLTDVMAMHVLSIEKSFSASALLIALFESRVEMVVLNDDGDPLFVRELGFHWKSDNMERLRKDIERTLLFAKQRLDIAIDHVSLMGLDAEEAANNLQSYFSIALEPDTLSTEDSFWAAEVNRLPKRTTTNFIPRSMQRAITSRQLLVVSRRMAMTAALIGLVIIASVEYVVFTHADQDNQIAHDIDDLKRLHAKLQSQHTLMKKLEHQALIIQPAEYVLPVVFVQRLGDLMPDSMLLNRVRVRQNGKQWQFQLHGANQPTLTDTADSVELLEKRLQSSPWHANISSSWREEWLDQLRSGRAAEKGLIGFQVNGELQ